MAEQQNFGLYVPSTEVWDTSQIANLKDESEDLKELLVRMYFNLNRMSLALNLKDSAIYDTSEFVTGAGWFQSDTTTDPSKSSIFRPTYRTVVDCGALANTAATSTPHNITCTTSTTFVKIYGAATKPTAAFSYIPLPFASPTLAENIKVEVDGTNVVITTGSNRTAYTRCYIVLEYLQD